MTTEETKGADPASALTAELEGEPLCFVVRKRDGKFLRGARWWKWTRNWRRAALLSPGFVREYCLGKKYGIASMDDVDLYTVQMPPSNAELRGAAK